MKFHIDDKTVRTMIAANRHDGKNRVVDSEMFTNLHYIFIDDEILIVDEPRGDNTCGIFSLFQDKAEDFANELVEVADNMSLEGVN